MTGLKKIEAIIKPFKLDEVKEALLESGVQGMTAIPVSGCGNQKGHAEIHYGVEYAVDWLPRVKIEVTVPVDMLAKAVDALQKAARTGRVGDGKIFISHIDEAISIRTGETGEAVLNVDRSGMLGLRKGLRDQGPPRS